MSSLILDAGAPGPAETPQRLRLPVLRPRTAGAVAAGLSLYLLVTCNIALMQALVHLGRAPSVFLPQMLGMSVWIFFGSLALLSLFAWPRIIKPIGLLLVVLAGVVQHYMLTYHMVMDPSMVANVLQTDVREASDLFSVRLVVDVLMVSVPAALWLWAQPIQRQRPLRRLAANGVLLAVSVVAAVGGTLALSRELAPLMRNEPQLRYMMNPLASIYSAGVTLARPFHGRSRALVPISGGAHLGAIAAAASKPAMLVLVVGETARADHFGLNGYARDTTPELGKRDVMSFGNVRSCGTSTLASVPCMFSHLGKQGFEARGNEYENLLDVLQASGMAVLWLDNQAGCKGVCDRVPNASTSGADSVQRHAALCPNGECLDDVMLDGLDERIAALPPERLAHGVVLVMHQMGSHGPAYFKRSNTPLKRFMPECVNTTLSECSHSELVNAYDNSIAYTDHFLARTIDWLGQKSGRFDTGLLYVSDHGESLGEYGLYLHGMPYALAPDVQKQVPMVAWLGGGLAQHAHVDTGCVRAGLKAPLSHDNLYPTVLGLMDVQSPTYQRAQDAFAPCRSADLAAGAQAKAATRRPT